ncbi:MAG TPA: IS4 family transposase, partial [Anaerolineae bacterium]|nr:IS4 family transposase [Anaerolineae bacterium]
NLRLYHKVLKQLCKWLPQERITRQRNMALLVAGLYLSMAIHLSHIADTWHLPGRSVSLVNRLRRFLDNQRVSVASWYRPLASQLLATFAGKQLRLVIDCTKVGFNHRLMTIGLAYRKRTLPLAWSVHEGNKGSVTTKKQIALFEQIRFLIPPSAEVWVMGDTAFQHVPLLRWLRRRGWHFVIRQQGCNKVYHANHGWLKINAFPLAEGQTRVFGWVRITQKYNAGWFWLVLHWQDGEDEPWYLLSDRAGEHDLIRLYKVRMWIEEMYGDMKGHGFDLEATHLDDADRISRLVLGVCIAFVWFISLGSWVVKRGLRHFIDRKDRRDKSYFRLGWDWLKRCQRLNQPFVLRFCPYP